MHRVNRPRPEIRLNYQVDQKNKEVLLLIKDVLGGNISKQDLTDNFSFNISSYGSVRKIIKYFYIFHLQSRKYVNYLKWRKAYVITQEKGHLTQTGIDKITKLKNSMNRNSD